MPACITTAIAVTMMNRGTRFSIKLDLRYRSRRRAIRRRTRWLQVLGGRIFARRLVVCLSARVVGSPELIFLLVQNVASTIDPFLGLRTYVVCSRANVVAALFCSRTQRFPGLVAGAW